MPTAPQPAAPAPSRAQDLKALRLVFPFLWPKDDPGLRVRLVASIALLGLIAALNAVVPILFARAVDELTAPPEAMADALVAVPLALLLAYGAVHWLSRTANEFRWALYGPIEQRIRRRLGVAVFRHVHDLSLRFHLSRRTGQLSRVLDNGMRGVAELLFNAVFLILPLAAEIVIICGVLLAKFETAFTAIVVVTLTLYVATLVIASEWLRQHQRRAVVEGAEAHGKAVDSILNYETVKYFGNEAHIAERYDGSLREVERLTVRALTRRSLTGVIQVTVLGLGMTTLMVMAGHRVAAGAMTMGGFVLVNAYLLQLVRPLDRLGAMYRQIKQALTDLEQMLGLLDERAEIVDAADAVALPPGSGAVRLDAVSFAYDPRRPVLHEVSFAIRSGATTAIVGPSGAGKSTIGRLLFRFYDPTEGTIAIDGCDVAGLTQDSIRAAIAVVPQDTVLFNDSIAYNLAFGRPESRFAEIEAAARLAEIHDFIASLPDGYDTVVGERGLKLSGGEKQRIAIARAVLKRPRIFLFDEATSALDSHTEQAIQRNIRAVSADITTLIIAHRLSTVVHADEILFLDNGRVIERGTHDALLTSGGPYAAMWRRQLEGPDDDDGIDDAVAGRAGWPMTGCGGDDSVAPSRPHRQTSGGNG